MQLRHPYARDIADVVAASSVIAVPAAVPIPEGLERRDARVRRLLARHCDGEIDHRFAEESRNRGAADVLHVGDGGAERVVHGVGEAAVGVGPRGVRRTQTQRAQEAAGPGALRARRGRCACPAAGTATASVAGNRVNDAPAAPPIPRNRLRSSGSIMTISPYWESGAAGRGPHGTCAVSAGGAGDSDRDADVARMNRRSGIRALW